MIRRKYSNKTKKRVALIFGGMIVISIVLYVIHIERTTPSFFDEEGWVESGEELILTDLNEEFHIKYRTTLFPDLDTSIAIYQGDKYLISYAVETEEYTRPEIKVILDTEVVRCYEVGERVLLYRFSGEDYMSLSLRRLKYYDKDEYIEEYTGAERISKELLKSNEWKWYMYFPELLLYVEDEEISTKLIRFSKGRFTEEELKANENSQITKEEMIEFSKELLLEYSN